MTDPLEALLDTIDALEDDEEVDDFPWFDAARWCPAVVSLPVDDSLPELTDDGCVMVCDPVRPWIVWEYQPPWWAEL